MAANWSTLNMPRLEMVKVPPLMSLPDSLPSLACISTAQGEAVSNRLSSQSACELQRT